MPRESAVLTVLSSTALRFFSFVFFRWIPGHHFPPLIIAVFFIYAVEFRRSAQSSSSQTVLVDEVQVTQKTQPNGHASGDHDSDDVSNGVVVKPIQVDEVVLLQQKKSHALWTVLTGQPSPTSNFWSLVTVSINVILLLMTLDLTFRSAIFYPSRDLSFSRVGYVSDTSAKIFVREPDSEQLPIVLSYRYADKPILEGFVHPGLSSWKTIGTIPWLDEATDFTDTITIKQLNPDTRYQYALSNNKTGHFVTAPAPGNISRRKDADGKFTFLTTSCIVAHFPYNPLEHPLSIPGLKHLSTWLAVLKPAFMLFLGDFIYADVPMRLGSDIESYRKQYRQVYASPDWPSVTSTRGSNPLVLPDTETFDIPWIHTYDDHEVANDWNRNTTGYFPAAFDPYRLYHLAANPPSHPASKIPPLDTDINPLAPFPATQKSYSTFTHGPATFFVLDTRRYRTPFNKKNASDPTRSILGPTQLADLLSWLSSGPPAPGVRWKIIASSVPFTKNWRVNAQDTWAGYLYERQIILEAMWAALATQRVGVVIVSGDRHEFAATKFPPPQHSRIAKKLLKGNRENVPVEFSVSPLNMFYLPFRSYAQRDDHDVVIHYAPDGNSKFGAVQIGREDWWGDSRLTYRLFVDGKETWKHELTAGTSVGWIGDRRARDDLWN